jgi:hypothetical protein
MGWVVGEAGFEPATSRSRTVRAKPGCATLRALRAGVAVERTAVRPTNYYIEISEQCNSTNLLISCVQNAHASPKFARDPLLRPCPI